MQQVIGQLTSLRRRIWLALMAQRVAVLAAWIVGGLLVFILVDYVFRLPAFFRATVGGLALLALAWASWRSLRAAIGFHPSLTQLALRVEESLPNVSGRLTTSIEFAMAGVDQSNQLAARTVRETETRLQGASVTRAMKMGPTWRDIAILIAVLAIAGVAVAANPVAASTGLRRAFLPFGDAKWPARTGVTSLMDDVLPGRKVHPRGEALPLRAQITRGPDDQRVYARFRLMREGRFGEWQELVLTHQGSDIHERLIDTEGEEIEFAFRTADDRSEVERVRLVPPPAVMRASLEITPPPYASGRVPSLVQELGSGTDHRSLTDTPSLHGSAARLVLTLNKPLPVPPAGPARDAWLRTALGWTDGPLPALGVNAADPSLWTVQWSIDGTRHLRLELVDEFGLGNRDPIGYRIEAIEDRVPSVTILDPPTDEPVIATAIVPLVGEATDDVAVARLELQATVERGGTAADLAAEPDWRTPRDVDAATAGIDAELDLSAFELVEGDTVLVRGMATDMFELDGLRHDPVYSPPRRLRVISELDFATQLRRQLGAVRQNAIRIESIQSEIQDDLIDHGPLPGVDRAQAMIAERVAVQQDALEDIRRQIETNRLDDEPLADLLEQADDLLEFAGRAASRAAEAIEQRQREPGAARPREDAPRDEELGAVREPQPADEGIVEAQQEVRDELADLIELLDRDEDTWVVTRQLESLLEEQQRLQERTTRLNRDTIGRDRSELSESERSELDRIIQTQRELRDEARQMIDELRDRAEAMEEADPESAAGMRSAANTAEQRELDEDMERAAERAGSNQLQNAAAAQQSASRTLEQMLEEIEDAKQAQTEQLLRRLASLIESIERLINVQENEIASLAAAVPAAEFGGRDRAMIRLNQNTQAVAAEARSSGQETRRIARTLDRAADAQGAAVVALRAKPVDAPAATTAEETALELLREAKAMAEELQEQTQEEQVRQRREELIAAYRAFVERQLTVRDQTLELAGHERLNRRQLVESRRLATAQDEIGTGLDDLRATTSELLEAAIFSHVHGKIDGWSKASAEELREGEVGVDVTDAQTRIAGAIGRLIEALQESMSPPEEFAQDEQSGGGGGQGGEQQQPLIPPVAELKLLQGIQVEIYDQTRGLDGREDLDDGQRRGRLRDLGQEQRELMELGRTLLEQFNPGAVTEDTPDPEAEDSPDPDGDQP